MANFNKDRSTVAFVVFAIIISCISFFYFGMKFNQKQVIDRALNVNKECYNNQDIEIIIFGEIQE